MTNSSFDHTADRMADLQTRLATVTEEISRLVAKQAEVALEGNPDLISAYRIWLEQDIAYRTEVLLEMARLRSGELPSD